MRSPSRESIAMPHPADAVFQAALGVAQGTKSNRVLAVHNGGRKLMLREKPKMSNAKFVQLQVEDLGGESRLHLVIGTDPRTPKALLDGRANAKSVKNYVAAVQAALDGSAPAPAAPVSDHYLQKKVEVPWVNPDEDPEIELDGNILAIYGL